MISGEHCFAIWAPEAAIWAPWAKPVLFASAQFLSTDTALAPLALELPGVPMPPGAALVIDLPAALSVRAGLAMAARGFRPVPLYNGTDGPNPVVATSELLDALGTGAAQLQSIALAPDAPPAFLLDANRGDPRATPGEGFYDNRWISLPQDFPSATFLLSRGIRDVTLIVQGDPEPATDLAHTLLRWQQGGLRLHAMDIQGGAFVATLDVFPPSLFRRAWYAAVALMGLRRSNVGGFGASVIDQVTSGGFYG